MNTKHLYFALAGIAAGFVLAETLAQYRPFTDAYLQGRKLAA